MTTNPYVISDKAPRLYAPNGITVCYFRPGSADVLVIVHWLSTNTWTEQRLSKDDARQVWTSCKSAGWTSTKRANPITTVGQQAAYEADQLSADMVNRVRTGINTKVLEID